MQDLKSIDAFIGTSGIIGAEGGDGGTSETAQRIKLNLKKMGDDRKRNDNRKKRRRPSLMGSEDADSVLASTAEVRHLIIRM